MSNNMIVLKEKVKALEEALRRSQHLITIGQLAAGIAHEINSPMQYVSGNLKILKEYLADIFEILNAYRGLGKTTPEDSRIFEGLKKIRNLEDEKDIEYLYEEIPQILNELETGINQVTEITWSMKEFSHPGKSEREPVSINHLLDDIVNMTKNEWKYTSEVVREYDSDLPDVNCYQGDLKQVFTNLIVNASHAIKELKGQQPDLIGKITIKTFREKDSVIITIEDNGIGIPDEIKEKIFEPFFTTKPEGIGTGQGLAITRSIIIDKHKGSIDIQSQPGKGTSFVVSLPLKD